MKTSITLSVTLCLAFNLGVVFQHNVADMIALVVTVKNLLTELVATTFWSKSCNILWTIKAEDLIRVRFTPAIN